MYDNVKCNYNKKKYYIKNWTWAEQFCAMNANNNRKLYDVDRLSALCHNANSNRASVRLFTSSDQLSSHNTTQVIIMYK